MTSPFAPRVVLAGCGRMGTAMLRRWLACNAVAAVDILDPALAPNPPQGSPWDDKRVRLCTEADAPLQPADVLVLAVKPQMLEAAAPAWRGLTRSGSLVLSVIAGKAVAGLERLLGPDLSVVRAMPNTPAAVGRAMTVAFANPRTSPNQRATAETLLKAIGEVAWIDDEALIDPVTAVSGGCPAYVFLLMEVLAEAGKRQGLPPDLAMRIARISVCGSGELAWTDHREAHELRTDVTSPQGTTLAALNVLMRPDDGLGPLFDRAIAAATERARELASI